MSFRDVFRRSFLEGFSTVELGTRQIVVALFITAVLGLYIYACYRVLTRRTFYSRNFNISLVAMAVITAAIILTIQSSVVVSLGMVGALSIVRFRTAVKDPMDLVFLFWSISVGIICGAGLAEIAVIASLAVTVRGFVLDRLPVAKAPMILVVNASGADPEEVEKGVVTEIEKQTKAYTVKSRALTDGALDLVTELRVSDGAALTKALAQIAGVTSVSLLSHDGEVTF